MGIENRNLGILGSWLFTNKHTITLLDCYWKAGAGSHSKLFISNFSSCKSYLKKYQLGFWRTAVLQHAHVSCWISHHHHGLPTSGCAEADSAGTNPTSLESNRAFPLQPVVLKLVIFALVLGPCFRNTNTSYKTLFRDPSLRTKLYVSFHGDKRAVVI